MQYFKVKKFIYLKYLKYLKYLINFQEENL